MIVQLLTSMGAVQGGPQLFLCIIVYLIYEWYLFIKFYIIMYFQSCSRVY